jgi:benzoate/toluate 1,2-dioxygenase reductase subunit
MFVPIEHSTRKDLDARVTPGHDEFERATQKYMAKHNVTMVFEDGRSVRISADENDTVYMASLRNKIRLMTDCLEGVCATCKAVCVEGEYDLDEYSDEALTDEEAAQREVLTCQMHVRSDCVLEFSYEAGIALRTEPQSWDCRVAAVEKISATVARLHITAEHGEQGPPAFLPGQYVHLSVPGTPERRSYSFANPPHVTDGYSFYIKILDQGVMSEYVGGRAAAGDAITMTGPFGRFYLRKPERPILMVAGGTGLAPMLSMMDHLVETGATGQPVHLLCGANRAEELFCLDRLAGYRDKGLDLTAEYAVVDGAGGWDGAIGHVTRLLRAELIGAGPDVYLCGPPPMIEAGERWLAGQGVDDKLVHVEKFLPS